MIVKLDFNEKDIEPALQEHLAGGPAVRNYIVAAIRYFNEIRKAEREGNMAGFGDKSRFGTYNHVLKTADFLPGND